VNSLEGYQAHIAILERAASEKGQSVAIWELLTFKPRWVFVDQLVGAEEIADRLGERRAASINEWRKHDADFPEPVASLKAALIWSWPEVEKWANATGRAATAG
jgi:hypothetical protein